MQPAHAATPEEVAQEVMGAPVYASDGLQVGEVVDLSMSSEGDIDAVRFKAGALLGFGEHVFTLSSGNFTVLRGAVTLDLPAEAIEALRAAPDGIAQDRE
jgi:sporulation protein YlmC with PRC-barrel domain